MDEPYLPLFNRVIVSGQQLHSPVPKIAALCVNERGALPFIVSTINIYF